MKPKTTCCLLRPHVSIQIETQIKEIYQRAGKGLLFKVGVFGFPWYRQRTKIVIHIIIKRTGDQNPDSRRVMETSDCGCGVKHQEMFEECGGFQFGVQVVKSFIKIKPFSPKAMRANKHPRHRQEKQHRLSITVTEIF